MPNEPEPGPIPFSRLFGSGRIGADFLERCGALGAGTVAGQVDSLEELRHVDFDPDEVHPRIRDFFEQTARYRMECRPAWHFPFSIGVLLLAVLTDWMGQFDLPRQTARLRSSVQPVRQEADGRPSPRAWIRTYDDGSVPGRTAYVAVYSVQSIAGRPHQTVALPIPGGNMSSRLRVEGRPHGGLLVTTESTGGMFLVCRLGVVRLPIAESIELFVDQVGVRATHRIGLAGMTCGVLQYRLWTES